MNRTTTTIGGAACMLFATLGTATAQANFCAPREHVVERLAADFGEARKSIGMSNGNNVVEMYASTETGTWTITMTMPTGITCIIGSGESWERIDAASGQPT